MSWGCKVPSILWRQEIYLTMSGKKKYKKPLDQHILFSLPSKIDFRRRLIFKFTECNNLWRSLFFKLFGFALSFVNGPRRSFNWYLELGCLLLRKPSKTHLNATLFAIYFLKLGQMHSIYFRWYHLACYISEIVIP